VIADSLRGAPQAKEAWPVSTSQEDISDMVSAIAVRTFSPLESPTDLVRLIDQFAAGPS
jgi:hypothetical protein